MEASTIFIINCVKTGFALYGAKRKILFFSTEESALCLARQFYYNDDTKFNIEQIDETCLAKRQLFDEVKSHIENWKNQCDYGTPFDYVGLLYILNKRTII